MSPINLTNAWAQPSLICFPARRRSHGTQLRERGRAAQARRRRDLSRRRHPRGDEGAAAIRRGLRRRLPGRAGVAHDGRAERCARHHGRARHPHRDERVRGRRSGHARRIDQLPAAGRGHVQVDGRYQRRVRRALESRLGGRDRRRADRARRGLWRRRLDHPGAQPRFRDEVAALAARTCRRSRAWWRRRSSSPRRRARR